MPATLASIAENAINLPEQKHASNKSVTTDDLDVYTIIKKLDEKYVEAMHMIYHFKHECNLKHALLSKDVAILQTRCHGYQKLNSKLLKTIDTLSKANPSGSSQKKKTVEDHNTPHPVESTNTSPKKLTENANTKSAKGQQLGNASILHIPNVSTRNRFQALQCNNITENKKEVPLSTKKVNKTATQPQAQKPRHADVAIVTDKYGSLIDEKLIYATNRCSVFTLKGEQNFRDARDFIKKAKVFPRVLVFFLGSTDSVEHNVQDIEREINNLSEEAKSKCPETDIYFVSAIPELCGKNTETIIESMVAYNIMLKHICDKKNMGYIDISQFAGNEELFTTNRFEVNFSETGIRYLIAKMKNDIRNSVYRRKNSNDIRSTTQESNRRPAKNTNFNQNMKRSINSVNRPPSNQDTPCWPTPSHAVRQESPPTCAATWRANVQSTPPGISHQATTWWPTPAQAVQEKPSACAPTWVGNAEAPVQTRTTPLWPDPQINSDKQSNQKDKFFNDLRNLINSYSI